MPVSTLSAAELVEDFGLYPRHAVDSTHVMDLARALRAGAVLPPVIADSKTRRIVDGFHRRRAYIKVHGENAPVETELRVYANQAAILKDAVLLNSGHGRRLDRQDRTRSALMLEKAGVSLEEIAVVLRTTGENVKHLVTRVVFVTEGEEGKEKRPAKPVLYPRDGETRSVTPQQYKIMESSSGLRTGQTVFQLTRELRGGLVDLEAPGLREKLQDLLAVLSEIL